MSKNQKIVLLYILGVAILLMLLSPPKALSKAPLYIILAALPVLYIYIVHVIVTVRERKKQNNPILTTSRKDKNKEIDYGCCSVCGFEQWMGYDRCQKCGAKFSNQTQKQ
ncbi:MAG: hypothetical protein A3K22_03495 [Deltaproteobacteria bacterium RBG_16_42_7]|nr:MAG: hypothetical protein A3K22_03495 [Deltaproteobacteria bacterium RBG_16_42_7]